MGSECSYECERKITGVAGAAEGGSFVSAPSSLTSSDASIIFAKASSPSFVSSSLDMVGVKLLKETSLWTVT